MEYDKALFILKALLSRYDIFFYGKEDANENTGTYLVVCDHRRLLTRPCARLASETDRLM